jgi:hypothetical protein
MRWLRLGIVAMWRWTPGVCKRCRARAGRTRTADASYIQEYARRVVMRKVLLSALGGAALAAACSSGTIATPGDSAGTGVDAVILTDDPGRWRHDAFEYVESRIAGDTLEVAVRYGGGCARHDFALLVVPVFMESFPVQMRGSLAHDAHGDPCRAIVGSRLRFDLTPLRDAYRKAYGAGPATIHLSIAGWPAQVVYAF